MAKIEVKDNAKKRKHEMALKVIGSRDNAEMRKHELALNEIGGRNIKVQKMIISDEVRKKELELENTKLQLKLEMIRRGMKVEDDDE